MHPNYAEAFRGRAIAYQSKGDYQEAIKNFTNAIHFNPDDVFVYCERGLVYDDKGDYESAIKDYSKVIALNPDDPNAYYLRGDSYRYKGDYEKAIKDYSEMIERSPNFYPRLLQPWFGIFAPKKLGKSKIGLNYCQRYEGKYYQRVP